MKKNNLFLLSFLVFFILSCSNMFEPQQASRNKQGASYLTVSGTISAEFDSSAVPRSAFPANDIDFTSCITNFYYKKNKADPTGTFCGTSEGRDYVLKLPALGTYYIDAVTTSNDETSTYKTSEPVQITLTEAAPYFLNLKIGVYLVMDDSSTAKGSVRLPIQIFEVSKVQKMEVYENGQRIAGLQLSDVSHPSGERLLDWTIGDLTKGVHEYTFKFYSDQACTNLVYLFTEKVTIFPGMETNTWVNNGNAEYIGRAEGKDAISITQACLDNFALTNFYVSSESGNDDNNGSYFAPLKTIEKALEKCADGTKEYTINLKGTFEPSAKLTVTKKIKIQKAEGATTAIIKRPASGHTDSMISISSSAVCTLSGIIINGYNTTVSNNGAGINNEGILTLKNCEIIKCFANSSNGLGGAVYTKGTLTMDGGSIGDASKTNAQSYSNSAWKGGAVYVEAGSFTLCGDAVIACNFAYKFGGGIYSAGTLTIKDNAQIRYCSTDNSSNRNGGGVYIASGTATLKDNASVLTCYSYNGAGVFINTDATFDMYDGSITSCEASKNYGGVSNNGTFNMYGGTISGCTVSQISGGGVGTNGIFNMSGGTITGCTAGYAGNGVYVNSVGTFNMSGSAYIASNNDVYLSSGTKITIAGNLTASAPVAIITPSSYTDDLQVLTTGGYLADNYKKIRVTDSEWIITVNGTLKKAVNINNLDTPPANGIVGISDQNGLSKLADWVSNGKDLDSINFVLVDNITLNSSYVPVGTDEKSFTGSFNGDNNTITFNTTTYTSDYYGVFGCTENATIENLKTAGTINSTKNYVGAVIGYMKKGTIRNCENSANITATRQFAGGIVGWVASDPEREAFVYNCVNKGTVSSTSFAGGIAGKITSTVIYNCMNTGNITAKYSLGGIAGGTYGKNNGIGSLIENCGNTGEINGTDVKDQAGVGGIAGGPGASNEGWEPTINNCWSSGKIIASNADYAAGIFGNMVSGSSTKEYGTLNHCYYKTGSADFAIGRTKSNNGANTFTDYNTLATELNAWSSDTKYKDWEVDSITGVLKLKD